ncbi:unnamed protein product [Adineta steineri]|uniref:Uncharacterized protein n=1 Tax=Adineta steineri TaxID=433720 RepID=A0A814Y3M5_9BILA|nr:unnamed protein product [Adineta steineri]
MEQIKRQQSDSFDENKRKKIEYQIQVNRTGTYFEDLANETVYNIFDYLNSYDIYQVGIGMCCVVVRERRRRTRMTCINQCITPLLSPVVNPIEQTSREINSYSSSSPPPYTTESPLDFDDSLPSYDRAIKRRL